MTQAIYQAPDLMPGYDAKPVLLSHIASDQDGTAICSGQPFTVPRSPSPPTIVCPGCMIRYREAKYGAS